MSDSVRPHRRQPPPTRLRRPWDFPGKNIGVGCHCLLQCMKVKSESEVTQSCPTLRDPRDCSLPGPSVHGIFQARVLDGLPLPSPGKPIHKYKKIYLYIQLISKGLQAHNSVSGSVSTHVVSFIYLFIFNFFFNL